MRTGQLFLGSLAFATQALADLYFSAPAAGGTFAAGSAITVTMVDNGETPAIADLSTYALSICYGGNTASTYVCSLNPYQDGIERRN